VDLSFFFLSVLGFNFRALCLLPLEPCPPALFALVSSWIGYPVYVSLVTGMTGALHHTQVLLVEMWSHELFAGVALHIPVS
jgi:hypothetical protein